MMMFKNFFRQKQGLTLVEILIVIAVISIISSFFIINVNRSSIKEEVLSETDLLLADLRYLRNLVVSRTAYDFEDNKGERYPPGGYGIYFNSPNNGPADYFIFADNGDTKGYQENDDKKIISRTISNEEIDLNDGVSTEDKTQFYFTFVSENQANTDMERRTIDGKYVLEIINHGSSSSEKGYLSRITLGQSSLNADGELEYVWANLGMDHGVYNPPAPPPPEDPMEGLIELLEN